MTPVQKATVASALISAGLFVAGITVLFGMGWGLLAGAAPFLAISIMLLKGMK